MGAFAELFPGRKLERVPRDEDSTGQGHRPFLPEGPLDLDSRLLRIERRRPGDPPAGQQDLPDG